jgi:hypothetical protein
MPRGIFHSGHFCQRCHQHARNVLPFVSCFRNTHSFPDTNRCSGYDLVNGTPGKVEGRCLSTVPSGVTLTYASTPFGVSTAWKTATTTLSRNSYVGAIGVVGWNIKFATPTSTSTSTSVASISTSATLTSTSATLAPVSATSTSFSVGLDTTSQTAAPSAISSSSAAGLTTGAKVGIGVGVGVGGVGAIALFVALYTLLRRRKEAVPNTPAPVYYLQQQPPKPERNWQQPAWPLELPGPTKHTPPSPAELGGSPLYFQKHI